MTITITWQTIITIGGVLGALGVIIAAIFKLVRWVDRQKNQDKDIKALETKHDTDMAELKKAEHEELMEIRKEQQILTMGILACLKGLSEQGCNGPVTKAINEIETYLNQKAHV